MNVTRTKLMNKEKNIIRLLSKNKDFYPKRIINFISKNQYNIKRNTIIEIKQYQDNKKNIKKI